MPSQSTPTGQILPATHHSSCSNKTYFLLTSLLPPALLPLLSPPTPLLACDALQGLDHLVNPSQLPSLPAPLLTSLLPYQHQHLATLVCDGLQGLDDHAHKPTLQRLPKHIQIVGSPAAATVAESLGFTNVIGLDHGKTEHICNGRLSITATAGKFHSESANQQATTWRRNSHL